MRAVLTLVVDADVNVPSTLEEFFMRKLLALAASAVLLAGASTAQAQLAKGYTDISAVLGLGNIGDAGLAPGARYEKVIKDLPDLGNGTLGIMVGANYYSWSAKYISTSFSYKYIPIGATANYHFKLTNKKLDAFIGAGLGYQIISCDYSGVGDICSNSALYFIGRVGGRYFFTPKTALYADAGAGDAALNVGVSFKLK
jgi:hypothetical protein